MKYFLVQLGCQMNISDSERIRTVLETMGYSPADSEEEATLLGIVACSVRQKAIDKVYSRIQKWNKWKRTKNLITFATGCILPADREKFLTRFDLLFSIQELAELPEMISQYGVVTPASTMPGSVEAAKQQALTSIQQVLNNTNGTVPGDREVLRDSMSQFWEITPNYTSSFEAFIPIQNGCDKFCTFCAVPYTRGREVSRPSEEILGELRRLVEGGYKSITLLGQNVNSYGLDKGGNEVTFPELMKKIGEYGIQSGKEFWVYFTSPHPRDMNRELIEVIAAYPCLAKQIHLPLQSGDDKLLMKMNRNHNLDTYRSIVSQIRSLIPDATLFTDIIVGFTSETDEQFEQTKKAMEEFAYNMAYIAIYSPRPGAASSRWEDDIPMDEKKRRLHILSEVLQGTSLQHNRELKGKTLKVLVEGKDRKEGYLTAKTEGKLIVRFASEDSSLIGNFVPVEITEVTPLSMEGTLTIPAAIG